MADETLAYLLVSILSLGSFVSSSDILFISPNDEDLKMNWKVADGTLDWLLVNISSLGSFNSS